MGERGKSHAMADMPDPVSHHSQPWPNCLADHGFCCRSAAVWALGAYLLKVSFATNTVSLSDGFKTSADNIVPITQFAPLIDNLLLVNLPQLIISFIYVFYSHIFTCMVLAHEYARFASVRKPLRVSQPYGQQRTTLWLGLPYRYIVPMMAVTMFLHWTVSSSFYFVERMTYQWWGSSFDHGLGYSPWAIIASLAIGAVMILALAGLSLRRLNPGIPLARSCSLAISAACHPGKDETDAAAKPVQYGIITGEEQDNLGRRRVGFSSRPVEPLVQNEVYV